MVAEDAASIAEGLWLNGRDSILHALDHFSERDRKNANRWHHDKWIVLSVYQAAECICNVRFLQLDPDSPLFNNRGALYFPSLWTTLKELRIPEKSDRLSAAEKQLFILLTELPDIRHQFMHRVAPAEIDVSIAAMCMMGLLKYIERLRGESASDIVWQSPPVEGDVVAAIRYTRLQEYGDFVALFLREKYGARWLPPCPACQVQAVVSAKCEACFTELEAVQCPECEEQAYYISLEYAVHGTAEVECQHCGFRHSV
jgi:hypothetical protein